MPAEYGPNIVIKTEMNGICPAFEKSSGKGIPRDAKHNRKRLFHGASPLLSKKTIGSRRIFSDRTILYTVRVYQEGCPKYK
jgi:hypothetical protein